MKTATRLVHDPCATIDARGPCEPGVLERPRYFPRQLVTAADLQLEHEYLRDKLRRHNRLLHGWGVVCGAQVCVVHAEDGTGLEPWMVRIKPGYILGPYGDEILIDQERRFDVRSAGLTGIPGEPATEASDPWCSDVFVDRQRDEIYIAVRYREVMARPVRVEPVGCGCGDNPCEYSRWRECYEISALPCCPESHRPPPAAPSQPRTEIRPGGEIRGVAARGAAAEKPRASNASLWGTVKATDGTAIPGARLALRHAESGLATETQTDANGRYAFGKLRAGGYEARVAAMGYDSVAERLVLRDATLQHNFVLKKIGDQPSEPEEPGPAPEQPKEEVPLPETPMRQLPMKIAYPILDCPVCPDDPWVVLAKVSVAADGRITSIDNCSCRRLVPSQAYLWGACRSSLATIQSVTPAADLEPGKTGIAIEVRGSGLNVRDPEDVHLGDGITVTKVERTGDVITVTVDVDADAVAGSRTLTILGDDCAPPAIKEAAVTVKRAPAPAPPEPDRATRSSTSARGADRRRPGK